MDSEVRARLRAVCRPGFHPGPLATSSSLCLCLVTHTRIVPLFPHAPAPAPSLTVAHPPTSAPAPSPGRRYNVRIQPVVDADDKKNIFALATKDPGAPPFLQGEDHEEMFTWPNVAPNLVRKRAADVAASGGGSFEGNFTAGDMVEWRAQGQRRGKYTRGVVNKKNKDGTYDIDYARKGIMLLDLDFIDLNHDDKGYWEVGVQKILDKDVEYKRFLQKRGLKHSRSASVIYKEARGVGLNQAQPNAKPAPGQFANNDDDDDKGTNEGALLTIQEIPTATLVAEVKSE